MQFKINIKCILLVFKHLYSYAFSLLAFVAYLNLWIYYHIIININIGLIHSMLISLVQPHSSLSSLLLSPLHVSTNIQKLPYSANLPANHK